MASRMLEMAIAIKGKLEKTYTDAMRRALDSAENVQKKMGKISQAMAGAQKSASALGKAETELASKIMELRSVQKAADDFRKLKAASQTTAQEFASAQAKVTTLAQAMRNASAPTKQMQQQFDQARAKAGALKLQLASQQSELQKLRSSLSSAGFSTREFAESEAKLREEMDRTNAAIERQNKRKVDMEGLRQRRANSTQEMYNAYGNLQNATDIASSIMSPFVEATQEAIKFESAMADVKKVVDFDTPKQFEEMSNDILKLSRVLPMAKEDIAAIVAAGGQSGIAREDLMSFAESAAKMGIAFDVTADQAGDMMAKWRTAFKMNQEQVVALADKVNLLGNTTAAAAPLISDVLTRIGPLGEVGGFASGEIAAMGASMVAAGVQSDVAATGLKNMMLAMTAGTSATKTQDAAFARLGLDAVDLAKRMQTDASGAVIDLMKRLQGLEKYEQSAVLSNIFGKESIGPITTLLNNLPALEENLRKVGDASQYTGSMEAEYAARSATAENKLQLLKNTMSAVSTSIGNNFLPMISQAADFMAAHGEGISKWIDEHKEIIKWAGLVAAALAGTIVVVSALALAFAGWGFVTAQLTFMKAAFLDLRAVTWLSAQATVLHTAATSALGTVMTALKNPIGTVTALLSAMPGKFTAIKVASMGMAGSIGGALKALPGVLMGIATASLPVIAAIGVIIGIGVLLAANWESIKETAQIVWGHISGTISAQVERVKAAFASALDKITEVWNSVTGQSLGSSQLLIGIINNIGFAIGAAFDIAAGIVSTSISVIMNLIASVAQIIGGVVQIVVGLFTGDWQKAWDGAGKVVEGFAGGTLGTIKEITGGIGSIFDTLMGKADEVENKARAAQTSLAGSQMSGADAMRGLRGEDVTNVQQLAAANQEAAAASGQASANAQQTTDYMQQLQQLMQNMPADAQNMFATVGTDSGAAVQAIQSNFGQIPQIASDNLGQVPTTAQTVFGQLSQISMDSTTAMSVEFNKLAEKCQPGGEAFIQAANTWGQGAYDNIAKWSEMMAQTVIEKLGNAWTQISNQFSAGLNVHVTTSGGVANNAEGGIYGNGAFLTTFAEEGPEAAIPLDGTRRAISLWEKAGEILGVLPEAQASAAGAASGTMPPTIDLPAPLADINAAVSSADIAHNATGGIYKRGAFLTTFAEKSPEAAIPLDGSDNAVSLWQKAGELLGVLPKAGAEQGDRQSKAASIIQQLPFKLPALPDISSISQEGVIPSLLNSFPSIPSVFPGMGDDEKKSVLETSREATDYSLPVQRESGSSGNTVIEINMPAITINGNADAGTVNQLEGLMAKLEADLMRKMEQRFPGMMERNRQQERRLSYAT